MKGENLVHLKFEYAEALKGKREILFSERSLMDISSIVKRYGELRSDEMKLKLKLHKKLKESISKVKQLRENFPNLNVERILHHEEEKNADLKGLETAKPKVKRIVEKDNGIDSQLRDIQRRLSELGA